MMPAGPQSLRSAQVIGSDHGDGTRDASSLVPVASTVRTCYAPVGKGGLA